MSADSPVHLAELVSFVSGGTPSRANSSFYEGQIPWVTGADLGDGRIKAVRSHITDAAVAASAATVVPAGTVLLVTRTSVGKVAIADRDVAFSQDITAIRSDPTTLHTKYLAYFLRTREAILKRGARGATIKGVTRDVVASLAIPMPSIAEQRRVTDVLDQVDALRAKRREACALLGAMKQAVFQEMFVAGAHARWPVLKVFDVALASVGSVRTGPFGSQLLHNEFTDEGVALLGIDNAVQNRFVWGARRYISEQKYLQLKRYSVRPGDVLITIMGTCGRCAVVPEDIPRAISTKHLCCISLDQSKCLPDFLHAYFLFHPLARQYLGQTAKGAIMDGLNMALIKQLPVVVPPIELQREFVRRVEQLLLSIDVMHTHALDLDTLVASLQQQAFAGAL